MKKFLLLLPSLLSLSFPAYADDVASKGLLLVIDIDAPKNIESGKAVPLELIIMDGSKGNELIRADELVRMHDAAFYVIITDESFSDYHYLPVQAANRQNNFNVSFTPKHDGPHYMWADVTTLASSTPVLLPAIIGEDKLPAVDMRDFKESFAANYRFTLKLNRKPSVNKPVTGIISISHKDGTPLTQDAMVLGSGTHVAGLYTDLRKSTLMRSSVLERPKKAKAAIPAIAFYFTPERAGNMRVFATFTLNGQLVHVPFGITIAPERSGISLDDLNVEMPEIEMPDMPEIEMPDIKLPSFDDVNWERILP